MPRFSRRRADRIPDFTRLDDGQRDHLCYGWSTFGFEHREHFEAAWEIHRRELVADFVENEPGYRPFAWWLLDHCQERPIVEPFLTTAGIAHARAETFGFLHTDYAHGEHFEHSMQETEPLHLRRLGLLEPGEWERCEAQRARELAGDYDENS